MAEFLKKNYKLKSTTNFFLIQIFKDPIHPLSQWPPQLEKTFNFVCFIQSCVNVMTVTDNSQILGELKWLSNALQSSDD